MTTEIREIKKPRLKNPIFVEGLTPGLGNVGRIAAGYLVEQLKAKKFAELWSSHFLPIVLVDEKSTTKLLKNEFYFWKSGKRSLIILIGDSQSSTTEGYYEICEAILSYIKGFKVKEMFTLGGLSVGERVEKPKVYGAGNDEALIKKCGKYGVIFDSERVGTIMGAVGLLIGLAPFYGIKGVCLLGETMGHPMLPDHKAAKSVLEILTKILGIKIGLEKLEEKVKEMEKFLRRMREVEERAVMQFLKGLRIKPPEEKPTYIG